MKQFYDIYDRLPYDFNLASYLLKDVSKEISSRVAFFSQEKHITYGELINYVKKFSELLDSFGFSQGIRVLILLPDSEEFIFGFLGTIWFGGVAILVNESYSYEDIFYILEDSRPNFILTNNNWERKLKDKVSPHCQWLVIDNEEFIKKYSQYPGIKEAKKLAREEEAFWVYTSGSTGKPKGVIHAHYSPIVASENYGKHILKLDSNDIVYSAAPMAFSYGLGATIYMPLYFKSSAIIVPNKTPFSHIEVINKFKPTVFFGIPHTYASIYAIKDILPLYPSSLRLCISAAEQLPESLWHKWMENYGISLCEGIGTTESTHIFISNTSESTVPGSSGKPVPGYKIRLIAENGEEITKPGESGFLEISGEGFMLSYWNKLKETHKVLSGQTLLTGDIYKMDIHKNFYFIGRKDNLVKIKGMWILPIEIENIFLQHQAVAEAAVVIMKGILEDTADIVAYIKLKNNFKISSSVLKNIKFFLQKKLPCFKIPRKIKFIDEIPRTATGKVNKKELINIKAIKYNG